MNAIRLGPPSNYLLLGGGKHMILLALLLQERGKKFIIVTSKRHAEEVLDGISFVDTLREHNIECLVSEDVNTDRDVLSKITPTTLGVSVTAAWIFKLDFIKRFEGKLVNSHGMRLPLDRGRGGYSWIIMQGLKRGACVLHQLNGEIDTGAIFSYEEFEYPDSCRTPKDFGEFSLTRYRPFFERFINDVEAGNEFSPKTQQEERAMYWPGLSTDLQGFIDWRWKAHEIAQFINAFDEPYVGASTFLGGQRVRLKDASVVKEDANFHPFQAGLIYRIRGDEYYIAANDASVVVRDLKNDGEASVKISVGDRLHTLQDVLDKAAAYRAVYTPRGLKDKN